MLHETHRERKVSSARIRVRIDPAPFRRFTDDMVKRQYPFATALALTRLARGARDKEKADVLDLIEERSTFVPRSVRATRATKRRQWAEVGWRPPGGQRDGDPMVALSEGGQLDGPVATDAMRERTPTGRTTPAHWPSGVLRKAAQHAARRAGKRRRGRRKPLPFETTFKSGKRVIAIRTGDERLPIDVLYSFDRVVNVKPKWKFQRNVRTYVRDNFQREGRRALEDAMRTAVRRSRR